MTSTADPRSRPSGVVGRAALLEALQRDPSLEWFALPQLSAGADDAATSGYARRASAQPPELDGGTYRDPVVMAASAAPATPRRPPLRMPSAWVVQSHTVETDDDRPPPAANTGRTAPPPPLDRPSPADALRLLGKQRRHAAERAWAALRPQLRQALSPMAATPWRLPVDWRATVDRVARGQSPAPLPRRRHPRWPGGCIVLLDVRAASMTPLAPELDAIATRLRRSMGGRHAVTVLELPPTGPDAPLLPWQTDSNRRVSPPMGAAGRRPRATASGGLRDPGRHAWHGQSVLLLSDLGAGPRDAERRRGIAAWADARIAAGVNLLALVPALGPTRADLPRALRHAPWGLARSGMPEALSHVLGLLTLVDSATADLLRGLVRLVNPGADASSLPWRVWNHEDLEWLPPSSCRLKSDRVNLHVRAVAGLSAELVLRAVTLMRTLQAALPLADDHLLVLRAVHLAPQAAASLRAEREAAEHFLADELPKQLSRTQGPGRLRFGAAAVRLLDALPTGACLAQRGALRRLRALAHADALARGDTVPPHRVLGEVRNAQSPEPADERLTLTLIQHGPELIACEARPDLPHAVLWPQLGPVPRAEGVSVIDNRGAARWLAIDGPQVSLGTLPADGDRLHLQFGPHGLSLRRLQRPRGATGWQVDGQPDGPLVETRLPWGQTAAQRWHGDDATTLVRRPQPTRWEWGIDRHGVRLDMSIDDARQTFRYIEPGRFRMGSPEGEAGRDDDEGPQHGVTLTRGYWLADTPCTQQLWSVVMGDDNPSQFQDGEDAPQHPAERVSWDRVQEFLSALDERLPSGVRACLPTEAQWEYAARAGSETAYWWGDEADSRRANWNGEQRGTTPVKRYEASPWGLYDVHGNVWEWCDGSVRTYEAQEETDPPDGGDEGSHARRGGSWDRDPRRSRSASRSQAPRGSGWRGGGFRLALRSSGPEGQAFHGSAETGPADVRGAAVQSAGLRPADAGSKLGKRMTAATSLTARRKKPT